MTSSLQQHAVISSTAADLALLASVSGTDVIRVLLIDDDPFSRETLTDELSKQGFAIQSFGDGASRPGALDVAVDAAVVVIGRDWRTSKISGIDLLVKLRQQGVPVMLLIGKAQPADERAAFDGRANDSIGRLRGAQALVGRLKSVIEASKCADQPRSDNAIVCGKLVLRVDVSRAYWNEIDLDLTLREYNVIQLLASNVGQPVTYRAIYDRLHYKGFVAGSGPEGYRANVRAAIGRIRNKCRACDPAFAEIENYIGSGYRWRTPA